MMDYKLPTIYKVTIIIVSIFFLSLIGLQTVCINTDQELTLCERINALPPQDREIVDECIDSLER